MNTAPGLDARFPALQTLTIAALRFMQQSMPDFADALFEATAESRERFPEPKYSNEAVAEFAAQYETAWEDILARVIVTRGRG